MQIKIMAKSNRFHSLSCLSDTRNGHFKFSGKIVPAVFSIFICNPTQASTKKTECLFKPLNVLIDDIIVQAFWLH
jgi:hypothetical protein